MTILLILTCLRLIDSVLTVLLNQQLDLNSFLSKCALDNYYLKYKQSVENILKIFQNLLTTVKNDMGSYLAKILVFCFIQFVLFSILLIVLCVKESAMKFVTAKDASTRLLSFSVLCFVVEAAAVVPEEMIENQLLNLPLLFEKMMKILSHTPDKAGSGNK